MYRKLILAFLSSVTGAMVAVAAHFGDIVSTSSSAEFFVDSQVVLYRTLGPNDRSVKLTYSGYNWDTTGSAGKTATVTLDGEEILMQTTGEGIVVWEPKTAETHTLTHACNGAVQTVTFLVEGPVVKIERLKTGANANTFYCQISCEPSDAVIHYTTDGSLPTTASAVYAEPFMVDPIHGSLVHAMAVIETGLESRPVAVNFAPLGLEEVASASSAAFKVDGRAGTGEPLPSTGDESLTYSTRWENGTSVTLKQNGQTLVANRAGEGTYVWSVPHDGTYALAHVSYSGSVEGKTEMATFVVSGKAVPVGELTIDWGQSSFVYDGQPKEPVVTVKDRGTTLTKNTHYLVEYRDNVNVGTAKAIVKGIEPYVGEVTNTFAITKATIPGGGEEPGAGEIPEGGLSKFDATYMYDGEGHTIKTNEQVAAFRSSLVGEFAVSYAPGESGGLGQPALPVSGWSTVAPGYTNAGEYVVWYKVTSANYEGFVHAAKVTVTKRAMSVVSVSDPGVIDYTGAAITPSVTVRDGAPSIVKTSDYTVSYADNVQPGSARIILTATAGGNYTGTKTVPFTIRKTTFDIDDGTGGEGGATSKFSYAGVYDGHGHGIDVQIANPPAGTTIKYSRGQPGKAPGGTWSTVKPLYTNVCDNVVWYAVECAGYISYTNSATVTITPKPLAVTADAKEKAFGTADPALTYGTSGLVGTDTLTGALAREPGDDVGEYDILQGTLANGNYAISYTGAKYTITKGTIAGGGGEEPGEGSMPEGGLSKFDRTGEYNGKGQTIDLEKLAVAFAPYTSGQESASPFRFAVNADGPWSEEPPTIATVGELVVWYKVTSPNYEDFVHQAKVTVVPKAITDEMVQPGEDAFFFDGADKKPTVDVVYEVEGKDICTENDYTLEYGEKADTGWWVTVIGKGNYLGTVTKIVPVLKRPVAPPVVPSKAYNGKNQKPTISTDERWTVVANPGGTDAGEYTNVVLRLTDTANYKWKGGTEEDTDVTLVFKVTKANNGWSRNPDMKGWEYGQMPSEPNMGQARYGTVRVAYRKAGTDVSTETSVRPELPGKYIARFWVDETENYIGVAVNAPKEVEFEITEAVSDYTETTTTPVPVPCVWLDAYLEEFGGGKTGKAGYETAGNAMGANGVALWESYVAGLDPVKVDSRFTVKITLDTDGKPIITWDPALNGETSEGAGILKGERVYRIHGKVNLEDAAWTPDIDPKGGVYRFYKITVELPKE